MKTKILVLHKNRLLIGTVLAILILIMLFLLIRNLSDTDNTTSDSPVYSDNQTNQTETTLYHAGVYTTSFQLGNSTLSLEMVIDPQHIKSIRLINLEESVATMYPLMNSALTLLAEQLTNDLPLSEIKISDDLKYTQNLLLNVMKQTLSKAAIRE